MARLAKFAKGQMIFRQGQPCPGVYVIGSGLVRVFKTAPSGKEHVLHMVGAGNTFAEVAAIGGFDCPANAEAVVPTVCALLPLDRFRKAIEEDHALTVDMMMGLTGWVRQLVDLMEDIVLRDAAGRLARFLLEADSGEDGSVALPTLKRHVASHLNLTSETLSRTIRRFTEAGLIEPSESARVRIVDRQRLREIADGVGPRL